MKYTFILILFFVLSIKCVSSSKEEVPTKNNTIPDIILSLDVTQEEFIPLSNSVYKIDIVPLEMTNKSIIGTINKVLITSQDIWISHRNDELIYRFSKQGKYINKVGKIGQGPGEYIRMSSFFIDESQNEIYVISFVNGINVYDFEGKFKRRAVKLILEDLFPANKNRILLYDKKLFLSQNLPVMLPISNPQDSLWSIAEVDSNFKIKKMFKNPAHQGKEVMIEKNRSKAETFETPNYWTENATSIDLDGNNFKIKYPDTDTIYQYDPNSDNFIPVYTINTSEEKGDYKLTHSWIKERKAFDYFTILDFFDTKNYIYLTGRKKKNLYTFAYNKETGKVDISEREGKLIERKLPWFSNPYLRLDCPFILNNDICGGNFEVKYRSNGKYWVDVLEYGTDNNWIDIEKVKNSVVKDEAAKEKFVKILNETGENSNPVLVIATLK